ncbi:Dehydrosqualene desaturase (4,4'-diapophytoenedesaturase) [Enterococcus sp. HSIEG1]|nr:Dehydrosqualene desaturase (4,4'-diapophytoenedesaturase) [Enterococcus sp. HSIEG1]
MKKNRGKYTNKKISRMAYSCSCFLLYLGLDKKYEANGLHSIYFAEDFKKMSMTFLSLVFCQKILPFISIVPH